MINRISTVALALAGVAIAGSASAQPLDKTIVGETIGSPAEEVIKKPEKSGIDWRINSGATFNLSDNRAVLGQTDGTTIAFGFKLDAGLDWFKGNHELRNTLIMAAGVTRTAALPEFVKSQDAIEVESIYLYHFNDWLGAFARVGWASTMFRGTDVRAAPTDYSIDAGDGTAPTAIRDTRLLLTDPLLPSRFKQSLGIFAQPVREEIISLEARIGVGARETLADGQNAIQDVADTPAIEVITLKDVLQAGAEGTLEAWGSFEDKKITYRVGVEGLLPFVTNDEDRSATSLYNILFKGDLSFKLVDWASLDYSIRAWREEQLLSQWQVQNQLLFTMGLSAGSASPEE